MSTISRWFSSTVLGLIIFTCGAVAAHAVSALLGLTVYVQEQSNWCWVATSKSVVRWETGLTPTQCSVYKWGKGGTTCPNNTGNFGNVSSIFVEAGMNPGVQKTGAVSYSEIQDQISRLGHPVMARWGWVSTGNVSGHMLVITAFNTTGSTVTYIDPLRSTQVTTTYAKFVGDGVHTWTHSLYKMS